MSTAPTFSTQLIGQTEKTLNAILARLLAGTGLSEPQWVTLTVAVMSGGTADREAFVSRIAESLKVGDDAARACVDELTAAQLIEVGGSSVHVTDAGKELQARIRGEVVEITDRMWGDLPPEDLAAAARVLTTVLERANAELAHT
ncbi:MAG TPA: MarR family winged helix-turn-helix transcriptional regulator [Solirubrobacteraceae bacterium]|nr:MarR family winged helix-turn-helix transcriptional regulator [Solirubrobacteraceae bacterium]